MSYLILNALKNIRSQKKSYIFFSVQILVAFVLMFVFGSIAESLKTNLGLTKADPAAHSYYFRMQTDYSALSDEEIRKQQEEFEKIKEGQGEIYIEEDDDISEYLSSAKITDDYYLTYGDYQWIKDSFGDKISVSFSTNTQSMGVILDPELDMNRTDGVIPGYKKIPIFFVTDGYFINNYYNENVKDFFSQKTAYLPDRYDEMGDTVFDSDVQISEFLNWIKNKGYEPKKISEIKNDYSDRLFWNNCTWYPNYNDDTVSLESAVILPYELFEDFCSDFKDKNLNIIPDYNLISINFSGEVNPNIIKKISDHLAETHNNTKRLEAYYYTPYEIFENYAESQIQLAEVLNFLAVSSMIITGVGFIGLILVIFNNRKKKLAVSLVTGATYKDLYIEIILEIEAVILSGALLGEIFGEIILNIVSKKINFVPIETDMGIAALLPLIFAAMGIIISLTALYKLFKMEPNEILKKE